MHFKEALDYLETKAKNAQTWEEKTTLWEIYGVLLRSGLQEGNRWAAKIETVVEYVEAGNYAFCFPDARKLLDKRKYSVKKG